jgi:hypothetical protein
MTEVFGWSWAGDVTRAQTASGRGEATRGRGALYASTTATVASPNRHAKICLGAVQAGNRMRSSGWRGVAVRQIARSDAPDQDWYIGPEEAARRIQNTTVVPFSPCGLVPRAATIVGRCRGGAGRCGVLFKSERTATSDQRSSMHSYLRERPRPSEVITRGVRRSLNGRL